MTLTSLLVCADASAVQVLSRILVDLGIAVEHCSDPSAAALRLAAQHFDAILLDCDDQPSAIELIALARKEPANKTTLFIAMVDARNQVRDLFSKGVNFIVYKPISRNGRAAVCGRRKVCCGGNDGATSVYRFTPKFRCRTAPSKILRRR